MKPSVQAVKRHTLITLQLIIFILSLNAAHASTEKPGYVPLPPLMNSIMMKRQMLDAQQEARQEGEKQARLLSDRRTNLLHEQHGNHINSTVNTIVVNTPIPTVQFIEKERSLLSGIFPWNRPHITNVTFVTNITVNTTIQHMSNLSVIPPPAPTSSVDTHIGELITLYSVGNFTKVIHQTIRFTQADWNNALPINWAIATYIYGWALYKFRRYDDAQKTFHQLTGLITPHGAKPAAYLMLADIALARKDPNQAKHMLKTALDTFDAYDNFMEEACIEPTPRSTIHSKLARILDLTGDPRAAGFEFKNALHHADSKQKQTVARDIGNFYLERGNPEEAKKHFEESLELAKHFNDAGQMCHLHHHLAMAHSNLDHGEEALEHAKAAHQLALTNSHIPDLLTCATSSLGSAHLTLGNYKEARKNYGIAHAHATHDKNKNAQTTALGNLANVHACTGNYQEAIRCYDEILTLPSSENTKHVALHNRAISYHDWTTMLIGNVYENFRKNWNPPRPEGGIQGQDPQITIMEAYRQNSLPFDPDQIERLKEATNYMTRIIEDLHTLLAKHEELVTSLPPISNLHDSLLQQSRYNFETLQNALMILGNARHALRISEQSRNRRVVEMIRRRNTYNEYALPLSEENLFDFMKLQESPTIQFSLTSQRLITWYFNPSKKEKYQLQTFSCFVGYEKSSDPNTLRNLLQRDKQTLENNDSYLELGLDTMPPQQLQKAEECLRPLALSLQKDFLHRPFHVINLTGDYTGLMFKIIGRLIDETGDLRFSTNVSPKTYISVAHMMAIADQEQPTPFESSLSEKEKSLTRM
ncbi:tetratricopeptide repeat protein [Parendozoicomonas sp. Alg238-R29]|uniref:tetratricopeptide repeat protein n=1 Tax=Parendozoicomonas sp. Alg238-R29 TaxID=2993446 RepID=UPI00248D84A7|nr:tetratricopeptide repeat protein [Parendozoicomonas sp. Alg238-R29]